MSDVTKILTSIEEGDPHASDRLLPLVYEELRRLARARLAAERPGQTLQATALVNEAYLRLVGGGDVHWNSRAHFFGAAAEAMRRILVDRARHKRSQRAGGGWERVELAPGDGVVPGPQLDVLEVDEALENLKVRDPRAAGLVNLRFFAGLTMAEAAQALGISVATAENDWIYAKAFLQVRLREGDDERR